MKTKYFVKNLESEIEKRTINTNNSSAADLLGSLFSTIYSYEKRFEAVSELVNNGNPSKKNFNDLLKRITNYSSTLNRTYKKFYSKLQEWEVDLSRLPKELNYLERLN